MLVVAVRYWQLISRPECPHYWGGIKPYMDVITEESLVDKQVLRPNGQHLLHVNLLHTIEVKLVLLGWPIQRVVFPHKVLFVPDLIQIHTAEWDVHNASFFDWIVIEQYLDELPLLSTKLMRAVHVHLLFHLQFIVHSIVNMLIWFDHVHPIKLALVLPFDRIQLMVFWFSFGALLIGSLESWLGGSAEMVVQALDQELDISVVADGVGCHYVLFILIVVIEVFVFIKVIENVLGLLRF